MRFLGRRIQRTRCLLIATYRDDELTPTHLLRSVLGELTDSPFAAALEPIDPAAPNTQMRITLQRRTVGVPGDMGWQQVGSEVTLRAQATDFNVTWTGAISLPEGALEVGDHRLLVTEIETFPRDRTAYEPEFETTPHDFVRERVVYADTFEL